MSNVYCYYVIKIAIFRYSGYQGIMIKDEKIIFLRNFLTIILFIIKLKLSDGKKPKYTEDNSFV